MSQSDRSGGPLGAPFLLLSLYVASAIAVAGACAPDVRPNASSLRKNLTILREATVPNPAYDAAGVAAIASTWASVDADVHALEGGK